MEGLLSHGHTELMTRSELATIPRPTATDTFHPIPHVELVQSVLDGLAFRHINIVKDQYAVSVDGMKLFGLMELEQGFDGARYSLGIRNANDKSMRLAMTVGFRVFVCDNMAFWGDFTPVLHKHTKNFNLMDAIAVGLDRMQRNFAPMKNQVLAWRETQVSDENAKLLIYRAFIEGELEVPRHLDRMVHENYFEPKYPEFAPRTIWSLQNAFTSAFKALPPITQFKATAKLGDFFTGVA